MGGPVEDSMDTDLKLDDVFFILFYLSPTSRAGARTRILVRGGANEIAFEDEGN
jgi:hypothetical protein